MSGTRRTIKERQAIRKLEDERDTAILAKQAAQAKVKESNGKLAKLKGR
jgi:hypothetical protein